MESSKLVDAAGAASAEAIQVVVAAAAAASVAAVPSEGLAVFAVASSAA
ncbi:MAG: hypothetical protein ACOVKO_02240 [Elstera sp.]